MSEIVTYSGLERAHEDFARVRPILDASLVDRVPHSLRGRVAALAADVDEAVIHQLLPAARDLAAEQDRIDRALTVTLNRLVARAEQSDVKAATGDGQPSEPPFAADGSYERIRLAFKLCLFSVRSLHDALNVSLRFLVFGAWPAKGKDSMEYTVNRPDSEVGALLAERLPGYRDWFAVWRSQRNRVKEGIGLGTFRLDGDIGIQFQTHTDDNSVVIDLSAPRLGLREVASALDETRRLMELVREIGFKGVPPS